ncbi:MAG TPA: class I SAM-dependent methyltransferase, partial [Bacillota bacterium]|nr:class I SAM-dependent methyltransferase [Bacillota bacterium]
LELNATGPVKAEYTIIDPYPQFFIDSGLTQLTKLLEQRVELLKPEFFQQLDRNDVLFIDSGHTVRIGSDINFLMLEVLPLLRPGVLVHFHDIPMPYEYAEVYLTNPAFRMLWTESYLLQAFLCFNEQFEVLLALSYLMQEQLEQFRKAFQHYNPALHKAGSGSFWIRRK